MHPLTPRIGLPTASVAGVPVHRINISDAVPVIDRFIAERTPHYNVAINAAKVVRCQEDPMLQSAIEQAHLLTADGQAVVWASKLLGQPIPGRVAGADLMEVLLAHSAERGHAVYLFGAREEVVRACVQEATDRFPGLHVAGYRNGYFSPGEEAGIVDEIRAAGPDILFLGFGTPAKEYFMFRNWREMKVPFVMGVGGSFDVFAGLVPRAPVWMQNAGLEWCYRFAQEPRRMWKRYLFGNTRFLALVLRDLATRGSSVTHS